ncbi:tRNA (guanine-N(7)-)-methyltransferase non-catalytic subunit trm82 [Lithohypha guttulata]|nr:tRNA (guanine-N(7)-)-methyltransferase non-catalytic subunit trm82 [Lithohypha guttulata]
MATLTFPAHKLCCVRGNDNDFLLAVTGTCIQSLSRSNGELLDVWPRVSPEDSSSENDEENERPSKRVKLGHADNPSLGREVSELSEASIEIVAEGKQRQKGERRRPKIPDTTLPHITHLVVASDGKHAVAITAEDKAVRVLSISPRGRLRQESLRSMPKKSCAIILSPDEQIILTADKFGDVYSLPLHPRADYQRKVEQPQPDGLFEPSASALTVHTKRNLDALKQQQKQKQKQGRKEGPDFEHKLLLGHVSLLTDLVVAQGSVGGKLRPFILTADRDEHIRVSRGMPQTHVIHAFCLGHTEFISKLCIVPWAPEVLVAGNGEPSLCVYDWQSGCQMSRFDLRDNLRGEIDTIATTGTQSREKLCVSGIWPVTVSYAQSNTTASSLLVALEGLPVLFGFQMSGFELRHIQTVVLDGNVLDVVQTAQEEVLISIDTIHASGSCKEFRPGDTLDTARIDTFTATTTEHTDNGNSRIDEDAKTSAIVQLLPSKRAVKHQIRPIPASQTTRQDEPLENDTRWKKYEKPYSFMGELIYGLENLRKRRGLPAEDEEAEMEEAQIGDEELEGTSERA